jgi:hypothetical protein
LTTSLIDVDVYFRWSGTESHIEKDSDQQNLEHANHSGPAFAQSAMDGAEVAFFGSIARVENMAREPVTTKQPSYNGQTSDE